MDAQQKNTVYESMTIIRSFNHRIRVWRQHDQYTEGPDQFIVDEYYRLIKTAGVLSGEVIAKDLGYLPDVNAIEVLNASFVPQPYVEGCGGLIYQDWS